MCYIIFACLKDKGKYFYESATANVAGETNIA